MHNHALKLQRTRIIYQGKFTNEFTSYSVKNFHWHHEPYKDNSAALHRHTHQSFTCHWRQHHLLCLLKKAHFQEHAHQDQHKTWASQSRGQIIALPVHEQKWHTVFEEKQQLWVLTGSGTQNSTILRQTCKSQELALCLSMNHDTAVSSISTLEAVGVLVPLR